MGVRFIAGDGAGLVEKVHRRILEHGYGGTLKYSIARLSDMLQEVWFDWRHNVDTGGITVPSAGDCGYKATPTSVVHALIAKVPVPHREYTFVDMGSGKGRALLVAAEYFRRVIGVEYNPEFHRQAEANVARYRGPAHAPIQLLCADAASFQFPAEPLVVYLFNPFGPEVLEPMLANLRKAVERAGQPAFVAYFSPFCRTVFDRAGFLERVAEHRSRLTDVWDSVVYRARPGAVN